MNPDPSRLARKLGHTFSDQGLLEQALTRRSADKSVNNERLEFLGDAVLGQIISWHLYQQFPDATEGQLTRMRAALVKESSLATIARGLGIGEYLVLGMGDLKSGGHRRPSILADALEAIIGAIALDAGAPACAPLVLGWFAESLETVSPDTAGKDAKTRLQEWLQARQQSLPRYDVLSVSGQSPSEVFTVACQLEDAGQVFQAEGTSRRRAEQKAATAALAWLQEQGREQQS